MGKSRKCEGEEEIDGCQRGGIDVESDVCGMWKGWCSRWREGKKFLKGIMGWLEWGIRFFKHCSVTESFEDSYQCCIVLL